jgi:uncharacterized phiE125 gp8 family phage protein
MPFRVVTPADAEPLTLTQVKKHLRLIVEDTDVYTQENDLLNVLISAARQMVEETTNRKLMPAEYEWIGSLCAFRNKLLVPIWPIREVNSVKYFDESESEQPLDAAYYDFADFTDNDTIHFLDGADGFGISSSKAYPVTVNVSVGYEEVDEIPKPIIQAMLLMIGYWYENKEDSVRKMPTAAEWLLMPFRIITFA